MPDSIPSSPPPSPEPSEPTEVVFDQYLAGRLPADDVARIHSMIESRLEWRWLAHAIRTWLRSSNTPEPPSTTDAFPRLSAVIRAQENEPRVSRGRDSGVRRPDLWKFAPRQHVIVTGAIVAAAIAFVVVAIRYPRIDSRTIGSTVYTTATAQRANVTLPDGSHVTLAPNTSLVLSAKFGTTTRDVSLDGEAYFTASASSDIPFVVHTGDISTRVLGTAFAVRRYGAHAATHVVVAAGRVAVGRHSNAAGAARSVVLTAGMIGDLTDSTVTTATVSDVAPYIGWTNGQIIFQETPVSDALSALERWYGYTFRLDDSTLKQRHVSATFEQGRPTEMLNVLKAVLNVTMTFDGNVVTLRPKLSDHRRIPPRRAVRQAPELQSTNEVGR